MADETRRFVDAFYPHVDEAGVEHTTCGTVLSSGGSVPATALGEREPTLVVNDFTFSDAGGARAGMEAGGRYVDRLRTRPGLLLSLWGRVVDAPLRHFHVTVFRENADAGAAREWDETLEFAGELYPRLDPSTVEQPFTDVVVSCRTEVPAKYGAGCSTTSCRSPTRTPRSTSSSADVTRYRSS